MKDLIKKLRNKAHISVSLSQREQIIVFVAALAVVWLFFDYVIYGPVREQAEDFKMELDKIEKKIQENYAAIANPESLRREIAELEQKIEFFKNRLPVSGETGRILTRYAELCNAHDIEVNALHPRVIKLPERRFNQVLVHLNLVAEFREIIAFMASLGTLDFFTVVDEFEIRREPGPRKHIFVLVLKTFAISAGTGGQSV